MMPSGRPRAPASCVRPMTAIFDAVYGVRRASGRLPLTDARLMMSPGPCDHGRQERPTHQVDAAHVDGEHLVPVVGLDVDQRGDRAGDAGVVDEDRASPRRPGREPRASTEPGSDDCRRRRARAGSESSAIAASGSARRPVDDDPSAPAAKASVMARPSPLPAPVTSAVRPAIGRRSQRPASAATRGGRRRRTCGADVAGAGVALEELDPRRAVRRARRGRRSPPGR